MLKLLSGIAVTAAAAWAASHGGPMALLAGGLALLGAGLIAFSVWSACRPRDDHLHDSTISTLVFPPSSQFQRPRR